MQIKCWGRSEGEEREAMGINGALKEYFNQRRNWKEPQTQRVKRSLRDNQTATGETEHNIE